MYLFYSIFLVCWGVLLLPAFIYRACRHGKYLSGLAQRLGRLPHSLKSDGRSTIWFHSCSVGETLSLEPLVRYLHERFPEVRLVFSTITKTGQVVADQRFSTYGEGNVFYFPIDLAHIAGRVLDWIKPSVIVIIDTEIWPNTIHQAYLRGIPVVLVNGRISTRSFRYYRCARLLLRRVFHNYSVIMVQSDRDALRFKQIGAPVEKITVTGNIKFDREPVAENAGESLSCELAKSLGLNGDSTPLIVAGSTHPGEEQILLEVLQRLRSLQGMEKTRLLLAPRHPERFDAVAQLVQEKGFRIRRRSDPSDAGQEAEVLLLDTVGELASAYRFATVVFIGGTLIPHGGHSIMEPALHSKPIVVGPSMDNFQDVLEEFRSHHGIVQISAWAEDKDLQVRQLTDAFAGLLQNPDQREALGKAAFSIVEKNRGAARRTAEKIESILLEVMTKHALPTINS